ncbi:transcription factor bHLH128-like isoform X2 [Phragmites australis]|uniref:transcription factor bHLH128-like isoform X2 n=1 Tax=Phragmites australis TaxID=29695 RepID=UPI002D7738E2|nr:transcription factor bHLH128-like isoform X2 [Phragmites australis]
MRRFLPAGGGREPSSSSSSGGQQQRHGERAGDRAGLRYGRADISLGRGHGHAHDDYRQLGGGEVEQQDGSMDMLARHSSSPAGFFSNLMVDNGYPSSKAGGSGAEAHHHPTTSNTSSGVRKMKPSQMNFTRPQQGAAGHLSQISEDGAFQPGGHLIGDRAGRSSGESSGAASRSFSGGFSIVGPWEESRDIIATLGAYDSQFGGAIAGSALEMAGMDRYMQLQQDQVPFKVRAKRGCATHPRSIAERERRTRISEKLRKLQELVPNMDKQTSTADMLDLAVEHIKGLQSELQTLKHEQEKCTCCQKR